MYCPTHLLLFLNILMAKDNSAIKTFPSQTSESIASDQKNNENLHAKMREKKLFNAEKFSKLTPEKMKEEMENAFKSFELELENTKILNTYLTKKDNSDNETEKTANVDFQITKTLHYYINALECSIACLFQLGEEVCEPYTERLKEKMLELNKICDELKKNNSIFNKS
ncbi:hypothetical protein EDEG_00251 [Edhazardia aedis USNM 41457]|uniref:Uncharacterized protein n=1 Tax=Edhazardia aedis (strain USNM 41457) TaxID=1003232 RepID=J9D552_EDHAE|nr:hypothetical protein EDEG_00251 [Edhazardia aedis USNM 41457]|eukprot:EJW02936.1 hypothetical protein EDEG_00251 [Edhazardia aedis USNM 41457]